MPILTNKSHEIFQKLIKQIDSHTGTGTLTGTCTCLMTSTGYGAGTLTGTATGFSTSYGCGISTLTGYGRSTYIFFLISKETLHYIWTKKKDTV